MTRVIIIQADTIQPGRRNIEIMVKIKLPRTRKLLAFQLLPPHIFLLLTLLLQPTVQVTVMLIRRRHRRPILRRTRTIPQCQLRPQRSLTQESTMGTALGPAEVATQTGMIQLGVPRTPPTTLPLLKSPISTPAPVRVTGTRAGLHLLLQI